MHYICIMQYPTAEQLYSLFKSHPQVCTDTRNIIPGSIFIALKGASFNGNAFAEQALAGGCAAAIIDEPQYKKNDSYVVVENGLKALQTIAREHRKQFNIPVIGITGSNGKTTTKELFNAVLSKKFKVLCNQGNFNNEIGVALTLLNLKPEHELAIVEMGARKQGDIKELVEIALPTHGIITNVGKAHFETMGGLDGVIKTKTELYKYLDDNGGYTFYRYEDFTLAPKVPELKTFSYGKNENANVVGVLVKDTPYVIFRWKERGNKVFGPEVSSTLMGEHNFMNIMAAVAAGVHFNIDAELINEGIHNYVSTNNRSQILKTAHNTLLMDAYNANPTSMEASIRTFANMDGANKTMILGEMLEVGEFSDAEHQYVLQVAHTLGLNDVFLVGDGFKSAFPNRQVYATVDELREHFKAYPLSGRTILIKGSRKNRLETLVEVL